MSVRVKRLKTLKVCDTCEDESEEFTLQVTIPYRLAGLYHKERQRADYYLCEKCARKIAAEVE